MSGPAAIDPRSLLAVVVPAHAPAGHLLVRHRGWTGEAWATEAIEADAADSATTADMLYDLASITKVFTSLAFMRLVEARAVGLDDPVRRSVDAFGGPSLTADAITWRQLLSHTAGLPSGVGLLDCASPGAARARVLGVRPDHPAGAAVVYSDVGFMLLGMGVEAMAGVPLEVAIDRLVLKPLGLTDTQFQPRHPSRVAPTEQCPWRGRRLQGEVHDEGAAALGGVAGHAGLFSTAHDLARLGDALLAGGAPVLESGTLAEMVRVQAEDGPLRRGLGFALWSPDPEAASNPLGRAAFGHNGFTGTSIWVDPCRSLVVVLLANAVYRGRDGLDAFAGARLEIHRAIAKAIPCEELEGA